MYVLRAAFSSLNADLLPLPLQEFQHRIPRDEVRELERKVKEAARTISPQLKAIACGSYRRGKSDCGDIDCLVTHKKGTPPFFSLGVVGTEIFLSPFLKGHNLDGVLAQILDYLKDSGFITEDLTSGKKGDVYMGGKQDEVSYFHHATTLTYSQHSMSIEC